MFRYVILFSLSIHAPELTQFNLTEHNSRQPTLITYQISRGFPGLLSPRLSLHSAATPTGAYLNPLKPPAAVHLEKHSLEPNPIGPLPCPDTVNPPLSAPASIDNREDSVATSFFANFHSPYPYPLVVSEIASSGRFSASMGRLTTNQHIETTEFLKNCHQRIAACILTRTIIEELYKFIELIDQGVLEDSAANRKLRTLFHEMAKSGSARRMVEITKNYRENIFISESYKEFCKNIQTSLENKILLSIKTIIAVFCFALFVVAFYIVGKEYKRIL
jgi:hypothetical protein